MVRQLPSAAAIVTFSGIDGAGKSTQIEHLCQTLHASGRSYTLYRFWDDVATLKRFREEVGQKVFRGDSGVGSPEAPIHRRDKNVQSPLVSLVRLGIYLLDALSLRRFAARAVRTGVDVVIFDRYLFDELANLDLGRASLRWYARSLAKLVPQPACSLILNADPELAFRRKPEYPLAFLYKNRAAYLKLAEVLGSMTVIAPGGIEEVKPRVVAAVLSSLPSRKQG